jgi:hypothetical protein
VFQGLVRGSDPSPLCGLKGWGIIGRQESMTLEGAAAMPPLFRMQCLYREGDGEIVIIADIKQAIPCDPRGRSSYAVTVIESLVCNINTDRTSPDQASVRVLGVEVPVSVIHVAEAVGYTVVYWPGAAAYQPMVCQSPPSPPHVSGL